MQLTIDYESRSPVDIRTAGAFVYAEHELDTYRDDLIIKASNLATELTSQKSRPTKASARRARKLTIELAKSAKAYRKLSVQEIG